MLSISLTALKSWDILEPKWRALEREADASFFQSWTWVGCQGSARFPKPVVLEAQYAGRIVALALCNLTTGFAGGETLWLGESGSPVRDDIYVEHNDPLIARDSIANLPRVLAALLHVPIAPRMRRGRRVLVISGTSRAVRDALSTTAYVRSRRETIAPRVDFAALPGDFLASLSANARQQLRRSARRYAERGPLRVDAAENVAQAQDYLDALIKLHQRTWERRNRAGAFANPLFVAFHRDLIARGLPRGEVDLLRVAAGGDAFGYLYNFRRNGRVLAYQSGFTYDGLSPHHKPGLTCHHIAIEFYREAGCISYDFLGGKDRYKTTLANANDPLYWLAATPADTFLARSWAASARVRSLGERLRRRRTPANFIPS